MARKSRGVEGPEANLLFGGTDKIRQVSPQPGLDPDVDARHLVAYTIGDAAVDHLAVTGSDLDLEAQQAVAGQIKKNIPAAESIELRHHKIARHLNNRPPESVDQQR